MDAVIIAGGKGTRLGLKDIPKPMVDFNGVPLIHHQINELNKFQQINNIYILSGHLSDVIVSYFDKIKFKGNKIIHIIESKPLGTAGALKQLENYISGRFIVIYGDTFFDINISKFINFDDKKGGNLGTLFVHPNDHPFDSDLLIVKNNLVKKTLTKPHPKDSLRRNIVNAAFYILCEKIFDKIIKNKNQDLARDIFPKLPANSLAAYYSSEFIKDIGTPDRLKKVINIYKSGLTKNMNFINKQKAVFFDRDGVINYEKDPFVSKNNFIIYDDVVQTICYLRENNYLVFIVTNQPSIAKGFITEEELEQIHAILDNHLASKDLFIDQIVYCPHHPQSGFKGEIKPLKIKCKCRKPGVELFEKLISHYNISTSNSYFVGDRYVDIQAGKNIKLNTVLIKRGHNGSDKQKYPNLKSDFLVDNLIELNQIIK